MTPIEWIATFLATVLLGLVVAQIRAGSSLGEQFKVLSTQLTTYLTEHARVHEQQDRRILKVEEVINEAVRRQLVELDELKRDQARRNRA
jgi:hypothetical protein